MPPHWRCGLDLGVGARVAAVGFQQDVVGHLVAELVRVAPEDGFAGADHVTGGRSLRRAAINHEIPALTEGFQRRGRQPITRCCRAAPLFLVASGAFPALLPPR